MGKVSSCCFSKRIDLKTSIDINRAGEDEFLFLPGVTRSTAQNIVQYRQRHHGFRQIEEILQIDGIRPKLFKRIRNELCLGEKSPSNEEKSTLINVNFASAEQLNSLSGLTPKLIRRIVQRRQRKGLFHFVDELMQIRGMNSFIFTNIRPHITVHHFSSSLFQTLPIELQTILLTSPPQRIESPLPNRQKQFRLASWNLQQLTLDKAQNPGVRQVICRTILNHYFTLIGVQEISSQEALNLIVDELNRLRGQWKSFLNEKSESNYVGFIYDQSSGINWKFKISSDPCVVKFNLFEKLDFLLINTQLNLPQTTESRMKYLSDAVKRIPKEEKNVVILGNFRLSPTSSEFDVLRKSNYCQMIEENTDIDLKMPQGSACTDHIWISTGVKTLSTNHSGVIRDDLTSPWIPNGWTWGGLVSDHCPIWTEFDLS